MLLLLLLVARMVGSQEVVPSNQITLVGDMNLPPSSYGDFQSFFLRTSYIAQLFPTLIEEFNADPERAFFHNASFEVKFSLSDPLKQFTAMSEIVSNKSLVVGLGFELNCDFAARFSAIFNKFLVSTVCEQDLDDLTDSAFVQATPVPRLGEIEHFPKSRSSRSRLMGLVSTLRSLDFHRVTVVYDKPDTMQDVVERQLLAEELRVAGIHVESEHTITEDDFRRKDKISDIGRILQETYLKTRVYVLYLARAYSMVGPTWRQFLQTMSLMGLSQTGRYFVVGYATERAVFGSQIFQADKVAYLDMFRDYGTTREWFENLSGAQETYLELDKPMIMETQRNSLLITPPLPIDDRYRVLFEKLKTLGLRLNDCPPFCDPLYKRYGITVFRNGESMFTAMRFHDFITLFTTVLSQLEKQGVTLTNGRIIREQMLNREYVGIDGLKKFINARGKGMRDGLVVAQYRKTGLGLPSYWKSGVLNYALDKNYPTLNWDKDFPGFQFISGKKPEGEPRCGFDGEKCFISSNLKTVIVGCVMAGVVLIMIGLLLFLLRKWQYERSLMSNLWKIERRDLIIKRAKSLGGGSLRSLRSSLGSLGQSNADMRKSHFSLRDWEEAMLREARREEARAKLNEQREKKKNITQSDPEEAKWTGLGDHSMALYNGQLIALKKIYKNHVDITRNVRKELKELMDLSHDNLNPFIGAVHEPPHVFLVSEICVRSSLRETLENDEIKLDGMFINSIVLDIIKGLTRLHSSDIKAHGRLKSSNCLIDSRWVVKLSSFGLHEFRDGEQVSEEDELEIGKHLLWTAPEILRRSMGLPGPQELQKADIYGLGLILYEIFGRSGPWGDELLEPEEIVELVKNNKGGAPRRPDMKTVEQAPQFVQVTMEKCWSEEPEARPSIGQVRSALKPLQKGMKSNIVDNMMTMMERYTNNLEEVVSERTQQLSDEKKKSERLLLMMLPQSVAETLKKGQLVEAEAYDHVTIYFSDIVGFTSMSSQSTPIQVVTFLNDLYTAFDTILSHYDAYKVETIGDAYMVVSGLPDRNGYNHAGEIASMSLALLETVKKFHIRHRPDDSLKLRIGIHSGSCVAGVVGLRMPRYCLFGDTVNTASRMESNGEALKIHCSGDCRAILLQLGGYIIEERGYVAMKGKGEQLTYWVLGEDSMSRRRRLESAIEEFPSLKRALEKSY